MRRRDFIKITAVSAIMPVTARAQPQNAMPVIGILAAASSQNTGAQRKVSGLRDTLAEGGFVDGKNVAFEYRWAETQFDRLPTLAADLVSRKVDVEVGWDSMKKGFEAQQDAFPELKVTMIEPRIKIVGVIAWAIGIEEAQRKDKAGVASSGTNLATKHLSNAGWALAHGPSPRFPNTTVTSNLD